MTTASSTQQTADEVAYQQGLVPLIIGVTGHRDLVAQELPAIRALVRSFLAQLRARFPDRPLQVLSALAEGADRLVAEVALELGVQVAAPLPMPKDEYLADFNSAESRSEFERLLGQAVAVYELPVAPGSDSARWSERGEDRNRQYAQLGVFLCAHCHLLLALWDGKPSRELGGTAQVVHFHHHDVMEGYAPSAALSQQLLVNDESDLVYHIVVSRDRAAGAPESSLQPLSTSWLTTDETSPRSESLPARYAEIFARTSEFNRDVRQHHRDILEGSYSLIGESNAVALAEPTRIINRYFCAADWLAIHFQQRMLSALRITHGLAFVMGLLFIAYSDIEARRHLMLAFFLCFVVAFAVQSVASRGNWHNKYLEYRALAEGLRVQFYWSAAGVRTETATKFSHDNFLQKQDVELGWIRNVMRVAGIGCDVSPSHDAQSMAFVVNEWIGRDATAGAGQLRYYRRKIGQYAERSQQFAGLGQLIGFLVPAIVLATVLVSSNVARTTMFVILAVLLLLFAVRQSYAHRIAEKDLIKQYEFMYSIFSNARRRTEQAASDVERRQVLRILGEAALDEHAEWVLRHRERPVDRGGLWRMET